MKRVFDIAVAGSALILLSPLLAILALLVRCRLGSPERAGSAGGYARKR